MKNIVKNVFLGFVIAFVAMAFACKGNGQTGGGNNLINPNNPDNPVLPGEKIVIEFDEAKVMAASPAPIKSGTEVKVGQRVFLGAINFGANKVIDSWSINGVKKAEYNSKREFEYTVNANDAKTENNKKVIKFSYEARDKSKEKIKVIFDNTVSAGVRGDSISSGDSFFEGTSVYFKAQLQDGKMVESWFINDTDKKNKDNPFEYTLNIGEAKGEAGNKSITVRFTEKVAKKIVLKFDESVFKEMRYKDDRNDETIGQNTEVLDGYRLFFVLKEEVEKEKVIDYITTNGAKNDAFVRDFGSRYGIGYSYEVNAKDAKDEGGKSIIDVGAIFKEAKKAILKFDSANIDAYLGTGRNPKKIQNDDEVKERDILSFRPKEGSSKIAEKWFVNGKPMENSYPKIGYFTVSAEDMKIKDGKNILHVTAELRDVKKFTIKFADEIKCSNDYNGENIVASGSEVEEVQSLYFSAKQPKDKIFENWLINGKVKREYVRYDWPLEYDVDKQDANSENVIEVSLSSHVRAKAKLVLEKNAIKAHKEDNGSSSPIQTGSEVIEGDRLSFNVDYSNLNGKIIDAWLINGEEFSPNDGEGMYGGKRGISFYLTSERIKKEGSENVIKVDYRLKEAKKAKLILQKDFIKARREGVEIANGAELSEGDELVFKVENDDKIVENWFINGFKFESNYEDRREIRFTLKMGQIIKEGNEDVIKIDCEVRDAKEIKIEYDTNKITKDAYSGVDSGTKVKEGKSVYFKTKAGIFAERWLINGKDLRRQNWFDSTSLQYSRVKAKDAIEKDGELVIVVSIEERQAIECPIVFESDKIECKNGAKDVASEEKVLEGTILTFKAKGLSESQEIVWKINDRSYHPTSANEPLQYTVTKDDMEPYNGKKVIRVWYKLR
jgi:lipoprotein